MSHWTNLGLPYPNAKGYAYTRDAALKRNEFSTALPDQSQRHTNWRKDISVNWTLTSEQVMLACTYLLSVGFSWFELELITNETPASALTSVHLVRLRENFKIDPIAGQLFRLSAIVETGVPNTQNCVSPICDTIDPNDERCEPTPSPISSEDTLVVQGGIVSGSKELRVQVVASGIYPIEAEDDFKSHAWLVEGWKYAVQFEKFSASVEIAEGEKVQIYADISHTQYPEAFSASVSIISGEIIPIYHEVYSSSNVEKFSASVTIISGEKVGDVSTDIPVHIITSRAWLVGNIEPPALPSLHCGYSETNPYVA